VHGRQGCNDSDGDVAVVDDDDGVVVVAAGVANG